MYGCIIYILYYILEIKPSEIEKNTEFEE